MNRDTVGAVASRVIVVDAVAAVVGPVLLAASIAPFTANCGVTVPEPQLETVIVYGPAPEPDDTAKLHPVAAPVFVKSAVATPVTDSLNVNEYVNEVAFVGVDCVELNADTDGGVVSAMLVSIVTSEASVLLLGPEFDALSCTDPEARRSTSVPSVVQTTVTVTVDPDAEDGVKDEHVAEPDALLKSAASIPETFSENSSV